jgi:uncharacterized protein with GYD domain
MPKYIFLLKMTDQGIKTVKDLPKRVANARQAIEKSGGKWLDWNLTMGEYDAVGTSEMPSDEAAVTFALALGSLGNVRSTTLKAFSESEMIKIVGKLP